jgi:parallel beta-helix repeat protein
MKNRIISLFILFSMIAVALMPTTSIPAEAASGILRTIVVSDDAELRNAMDNAQAGDEIVVRSGTYYGTDGGRRAARIRAVERTGTKENPIILRSEDPQNPARFVSENIANGIVLYILDGDYWIIENLEIVGGQKGVVLDNSNHSIIRGNYVHSCGQEAIHLRDGSSFCQVVHNTVENTGLVRPGFGEAIYIGSAHTTSGYRHECDYNYIGYNVLGPGITAEPVDIKEFVTGTVVEHNIMYGDGIHGRNTPGETHASSFVITKGNDTIVRNNTFYRQGNPHIRAAVENHLVVGWGLNNAVYDNLFYLDDPATWAQPPDTANNIVWAFRIYSGSGLFGENTISPAPPEFAGDGARADSAGTLTRILPDDYPQPDVRVPVLIVDELPPDEGVPGCECDDCTIDEHNQCEDCEKLENECECPDIGFDGLYISAVNTTGNAWIEIHNPTEESLSCKNLYLSDGDNQWQMPSVIVRPGQIIRVKDKSNDSDFVLKRMQADFNFEPGQTIQLTDLPKAS